MCEEVGSLMCKINDLDSCSFGCASVTLKAKGKKGRNNNRKRNEILNEKFCGVVRSRYASVLLHEVNYWNGSVTHHDFEFILHLKLK